MGDKALLTDDYVADLLAKEAKDCSLKYSTMGLEAYTSTPPSTSRCANTQPYLSQLLLANMYQLQAREQG